MLAQTRPGARGALLYHGALPVAEFGAWPDGVPAQIHAMEHDPWLDRDALRATAGDSGAELFLYPGAGHLFSDPGVPDHDERATALMLERSLAFIARAGAPAPSATTG
jgi:dienelactone hydrolase